MRTDADKHLDDADIYDGAAVSIQLVGRRLQEEKMIAIAEYVSKALKENTKEPPVS